MNELTNEQLAAAIRRVERGSPEYNLLFEELWIRCNAVLGRVLGSRLRRYPWYWSIQDVEDIKAEAAIKVWENLDTYEERGPFAGWVATIAGSAVTNEIRDRTGLRHRLSLAWSQAMEEMLDRGEVPEPLREAFRLKGLARLIDPEVQKQGQVWIIFADKAKKSADTTRGRYKAWRNGDQLDVYHWGTPKELPFHQREPADD